MLKKNRIFKIILIALCFLALMSKLFMGFDCDEQYALSMPYRLLQGDRLIFDIWDPYQLSSIFFLPIINSIYATQGNLSNLLLISRLIGILIYIGIGLLLYRTIRKYISKKYSLVALLLFIIATPKQTYVIDHSNTLMWFSTIAIISLFCYIKKGNAILIVVSSVFYALAVIAYPTQALLFPVLLAFVYSINKNTKDFLLFLMPASIMAVIFVLMLLNGNTIEDLIINVQCILLEGSHGSGTIVRVVKNVALGIGSILLIICLSVSGCYLYKKINRNFVITREKVYRIAVIIYPLLIIIATIIGIIWPPLARYRRYILLTLIGLDISIRKNRKEELVFVIFPLLMCFVCLVTSNQGIDSAAGYLGLSSAYSLVVLLETTDKTKINNLIISLVLISQVVVTGLTARVSYTIGYSIFDLVPSNINELKNIRITPDDQILFNESKSIKDILKNEDLLFFGKDPYVYILTDSKVNSPLTITSPVFDKQWVEYYKIKSKTPKYILVDKTIFASIDRLSDNVLWSYLSSRNNYKEIFDGSRLMLFEYN